MSLREKRDVKMVKASSKKCSKETMEVSQRRKGRLRPTAKTAILVHDKGGLQPPGSARALTSNRTKVLSAGSVTVLPPGNVKILPPGNVTIPLVSGVVAFR